MGAEIVGVAPGDVEGAGADVAGVEEEGGESSGDGNGDATASRSDVEKGAGVCWRDGFDGPLDEFFSLGAGDEDVLIDIEPEPGKPAFVEDVLYGAVGEQFAAIDIILPEDMVGEGLRGFGQAVYFPVPRQVFHYPVGDQGCLAGAVYGRQVGCQLLLCLPEIHHRLN
jgi:hypothetical protein